VKPYVSPEQEALAFQGIVERFNLDNQNTALTPSVDTDLPAPEKTDKPRRVIEFTPTPANEIKRREQANLQATFALAHTLRNSEPDLLRRAVAATAQPVTEVIQPRPEAYKGRHRRIGRFLGRLRR
jgi:hypothetical protein